MAPTILHGRNPHELPPKALGEPEAGPESIIAALTGPDGGLTTVNRKQRHITTSDPDVDFIDILDQGENEKPPGEIVWYFPSILVHHPNYLAGVLNLCKNGGTPFWPILQMYTLGVLIKNYFCPILFFPKVWELFYGVHLRVPYIMKICMDSICSLFS